MTARIDPEEERQRLARVYAAMSDGELEKLDEHAHSLTALARQVLEGELDRRELEVITETPQPPSSELAVRELVSIRKFRDLPEALLAKGMLESAGIECFLADDNMVRMDWFISNFIGGIKLQVGPDDADAAVELLDQPIPEGFDVEGLGDYQQPRCPRCKSLDISFEALDKAVAYTSAWLGVPVPLPRRTWRCFTCDARWQDDETANV
ncbi:MAG: DUF2007 domain-containing protein [Acidobacteriia bacterium]|nr:DUF2007 domain-containing protein [Terriglobia bacterium]